MSKLIIKVQGGMVQDVYTDSEDGIEIEVWDQDVLDGNLDANEEEEAIENDERFSTEVEQMRHIY